MLKIFDIETARCSILKRRGLNLNFSPAALARTASLFGPGVSPADAVRRILASVQEGGDAALRYWTELLDQRNVTSLRIPPDRLEAAYLALPASLGEALHVAAERIRSFHHRQPLPNWETRSLGGLLGQRATPVASAGLYVPGGTAPLPSSLLMSAIPAQVAGVPRLVVCTPPEPPDTILAVAYMCGVQEVYQVGGAQAIAALAFGTESIPRVDKVVGAGNLFVTLAKAQVYGLVGLDGLAGPTETMIIADETARPHWVAADLLAQAEHDVLASAILLTPSRQLAESVQVEAARQIQALSRAETIACSLDAHSGIVLTPDLPTAAALADEFAPEHLCLAVADPQGLAGKIRNAGGLFVGERSCEVLGDYIAGPSHVMPTGGTARFASPLNVYDFIKITSLITLDAETSCALGPLAAEIARAEGLTAHAAAADYRSEVQDV